MASRESTDEPAEIPSAVSHDLRGCVTALRLLVEAANDGVVAGGDESLDVSRMLVHVRLLSDLVHGLGAKVAHDRVGDDIVSLALAPLIQCWSHAMRFSAESKRISIDVLTEQELPLVRCTPREASRVMLNLLDNAIRHTPSGGRVTVRAVAHGRGVQVDVHDRGPPIVAEVRESIRRPPAHRGVVCASRGLALGVAQGVVEACGGRLWVPADGGSVQFWLPGAESVGPRTGASGRA